MQGLPFRSFISSLTLFFQTWRRMTMSPAVWIYFAKQMNLKVDESGPKIRTVVLKHFVQMNRPALVYIPYPERWTGGDPEEGEAHRVTIGVMSGEESGGCGKSSLVIRLTTNVFVVEYDPTIEISLRRVVAHHFFFFFFFFFFYFRSQDSYFYNLPAPIEILDTSGQTEFEALQVR